MDMLGFVLVALIATIAWAYERIWRRQQVALGRYTAILDRLPPFGSAVSDPATRDEFLREVRKLWLFAPDSVVQSAQTFVDTVENFEATEEEKAEALNQFILAMRGDCSFTAALIPGFRSTDLHSSAVAIKFARRPAQ